MDHGCQARRGDVLALTQAPALLLVPLLLLRLLDEVLARELPVLVLLDEPADPWQGREVVQKMEGLAKSGMNDWKAPKSA